MLVVDPTHEFINGMKIPYLTYWNYDKLDVAFANTLRSFKVM